MDTEECSSIPCLAIEPSEKLKNGVNNQPIDVDSNDEISTTENLKINGGNHLDNFFVQQEESNSSESDALVIDESVPKRKTNKIRSNKVMHENVGRKTIRQYPSAVTDEFSSEVSDCRRIDGKSTNSVPVGQNIAEVNDFLAQNLASKHCQVGEDTTVSLCTDKSETLDCIETIPHSNPYFNESLFELSQLSHLQQTNHYISLPEARVQSRVSQNNCNNNAQFKSVRKIKPKPRPCAQFLGLQPAVQFKCSKCGKSGFESIVSLQDHLIECSAVAVTTGNNKIEKDKCSKFKLTRKVFLCSACGTYYENWNLYMHMLEFHKRYVCLYCLGMFSILEDLFSHIQSKHNVVPGIRNSLEEFYNVYNEPCYVVCCECGKLFTEQDNFFYHKCVSSKSAKNKPKVLKTPIRPEHHVTGEGALNDTVCLEKDGNSIKSKISLNKTNEAKSGSSRELLTDNEVNEMENSFPKCNGDETRILNSETIESESDKPNIKQDEIGNRPSDDIVDSGCQKDKSQDESSNLSNTMIEESVKSDEDGSLDHEIKENKSSDLNKRDTLEMKGALMEDKLELIENIMEDTHVLSAESKHTKEFLQVDTRKVPKLSLKIPKPGTYSEPEGEVSDDSEKMEANDDQDHIESEHEYIEERVEEKSSEFHISEANSEIVATELSELEQPLDKIDIRMLLQKCLKATAASCVYCNHSRRIPVNGKQLGLHAIAQHRYSAVVKSITAEELHPESFVARIKECLDELENMYFNLESGLSEEAITFSHIYECFQCYYNTTVHKELYLHNRKFHSKNLLLCIMCKSNFYSYSELICHLCPGTYVPEIDLQFRCCMCVSEDLPSSFRLMVHLRKKHNMCDVCLDMCHTQFKLSNHVWKHKLNHFCYRCGIAYRNKPDITRHLFWKHGTESIVCKKCLQKKWPHMYHFCQPPAVFNCDDCSLSFSKAVYLKVHKRLHTDEKKHQCTFEGCGERFISRKLMMKHEKKHWEPPEEELQKASEEVAEEVTKEPELLVSNKEEKVENPDTRIKQIVDPINSLPELNLSESDSSDSETEDKNEFKRVREENQNPTHSEDRTERTKTNLTAESQSVNEENTPHVIENIWDNFKNYQASKDKLFIGQDLAEKIELEVSETVVEDVLTWEKALLDHDYCLVPEKEEVRKDTSLIEVKPALDQADRADHDYCFSKKDEKLENCDKPPLTLLGGVAATAQEPILEYDDTRPVKSATSSSASSGSDSSSCSCGSNCSCSSSSDSNTSSEESSNSDSSTEEGRKRQQLRRQKRTKQKAKSKSKQKQGVSSIKKEIKIDDGVLDQSSVQADPLIAESDLETTESDTDEEFYDKQPQIFARKLLEEKRAMILGQMGPDVSSNGSFFQSTSRPPTPPTGTMDEEVRSAKKKKKSKKRKKKKSSKTKNSVETRTYSATLIMPEETHVPNPETPPYYQNRKSPIVTPKTPPGTGLLKDTNLELMMDPNLRASKRRRVPNKFYGYSSDEDEANGGPSATKTRKIEAEPPKLVPPITIKTFPSSLVAAPKQPTVEPITLKLPKPRLNSINVSRGHKNAKSIPTIRLPTYLSNKISPQSGIGQPPQRQRNDSDSNESENEPAPMDSTGELQPQLYCYCRCPYDEVSEMIGCDSNECEIEWFHFECVGIMVPPKGQWFCPDCRKKKQRRELMQTYQHS